MPAYCCGAHVVHKKGHHSTASVQCKVWGFRSRRSQNSWGSARINSLVPYTYVQKKKTEDRVSVRKIEVVVCSARSQSAFERKMLDSSVQGKPVSSWESWLCWEPVGTRTRKGQSGVRAHKTRVRSLE